MKGVDPSSDSRRAADLIEIGHENTTWWPFEFREFRPSSRLGKREIARPLWVCSVARHGLPEEQSKCPRRSDDTHSHLPYAFVTGTVAVAEEVNANFEAVAYRTIERAPGLGPSETIDNGALASRVSFARETSMKTAGKRAGTFLACSWMSLRVVA